MNAVFLSILSAFSFAFASIFTRRAVVRISDAALGSLVFIPFAVPCFMIILVFSGQTGSILSFSWQNYLWLSASGLTLVMSGPLFLKSVQLVGANPTAILTKLEPIVSVILGILILGEAVTLELAVGALLIVFGITLIGVDPQALRSSKNMFSGIRGRAYIYGIGCGLARGVSTILVKMGLSGSGSPVAGAFISFSAATIVLSATLLQRKSRVAFSSMPGRAVGFLILVSLSISIAHSMRFHALHMAPVSLVAPLLAIQPVFLLALSYVFNRKLEVFGKVVIIGIIATVVGTILLV